MRFGFYVSGGSSRILNFLDFIIKEEKQYNILLKDIGFIFCDETENENLTKICFSHKIPVYYDNLKKIHKKERSLELSNKINSLMNTNHSEILFVFGKRLLKGKLLKQYKDKIINFHPALLPSFPGIKAVDQAIEYGSFIYGNTAHYIDEGIDTGAIIMQSINILPVFKDYDEILDNQIYMLLQIIQWLKQKRIKKLNRKVRVLDASYKLCSFVPNLEIPLSKHIKK